MLNSIWKRQLKKNEPTTYKLQLHRQGFAIGSVGGNNIHFQFQSPALNNHNSGITGHSCDTILGKIIFLTPFDAQGGRKIKQNFTPIIPLISSRGKHNNILNHTASSSFASGFLEAADCKAKFTKKLANRSFLVESWARVWTWNWVRLKNKGQISHEESHCI